jgi:urease
VSLVELAGKRVITGGNGLASGPVDNDKVPSIISNLVAKGFNHKAQVPSQHHLPTHPPLTGGRYSW